MAGLDVRDVRRSRDASAEHQLFAVVGVLVGVRADLELAGPVVQQAGLRAALARVVVAEQEFRRPGMWQSG